jgi:hypothetical protein
MSFKTEYRVKLFLGKNPLARQPVVPDLAKFQDPETGNLLKIISFSVT